LAKSLMKDTPWFSSYDIGDHTYGNPTVYRWSDSSQLHIGKYCSIASGTIILLGGEHHSEFVSTFPFHMWEEGLTLPIPNPGYRTKGDVSIGNDVWVGQRAAILSGVTVGDGAVIGAEAVVSKRVPAYAVMIGNPAYILRYRFPAEVIEKLLKIRWWGWPHSLVLERLHDILSPDVEGFTRKYLPENNLMVTKNETISLS